MQISRGTPHRSAFADFIEVFRESGMYEHVRCQVIPGKWAPDILPLRRIELARGGLPSPAELVNMTAETQGF